MGREKKREKVKEGEEEERGKRKGEGGREIRLTIDLF